MSIKAMKLALEALQECASIVEHCVIGVDAENAVNNANEAIKALEEALAKQEQPQELCPSCRNGSIYACTCTFKPAPQSPQPKQEQGEPDSVAYIHGHEDEEKAAKGQFTTMVEPSIHAGSGEKIGFPNRGQKQKQGEPVAVMELYESGWDLVENIDTDWLETLPFGTKLYTHPQPAQPKAGQEPDVIMHPHHGTWDVINNPPKGVDDVALYYAQPAPVPQGHKPKEQEQPAPVQEPVDLSPFYCGVARIVNGEYKLADVRNVDALVNNWHPIYAIPEHHLDSLFTTPPQHKPLTVRLVSYPESNGKTNWTAMFVRTQPWDGLRGNSGGITIDRGECWNRVTYNAERARFLLGERTTEPSIMAYGKDVKTPEEWDGTDSEAAHGIGKE